MSFAQPTWVILIRTMRDRKIDDLLFQRYFSSHIKWKLLDVLAWKDSRLSSTGNLEHCFQKLAIVRRWIQLISRQLAFNIYQNFGAQKFPSWYLMHLTCTVGSQCEDGTRGFWLGLFTLGEVKDFIEQMEEHPIIVGSWNWNTMAEAITISADAMVGRGKPRREVPIGETDLAGHKLDVVAISETDLKGRGDWRD